MSWHSERLKTPTLPVDTLILFLEKALSHKFHSDADHSFEMPLFSKPGRTLCYFLLSELSEHPKNTDELSTKLKKAQHYVDLIAQEHPWGLFDAQLPKPVLQHCAEVRLRPYLSLGTEDQQRLDIQKCVKAAPQIFPAIHALLQALSPAKNDDITLPSPTEEYLKLVLSAFNPQYFTEREEKLPDPKSLPGKICFTLLPRLIEHFMHADTLIKTQIQELRAQKPKEEDDNEMMQRMIARLEMHRQVLAALTVAKIKGLLTLNSSLIQTEDAWLQAKEDEIREKILQHALEWPNAILKSEATRLRRSLTPAEQANTQGAKQQAIGALKQGCHDLSRLAQRCAKKKITLSDYMEYAQNAQVVLKRVEKEGGKHIHSLTLVGRACANVLIVLTGGLLYLPLKKSIQATHATANKGWSSYFFNLRSRRAETIHCMQQSRANLQALG